MARAAIISVTSEALAQLLSFRASAARPADQSLHVRVTGTAGGEYDYALSLDPIDRAAPDDVIEHVGDLPVVVARASVERLRGATIDWSSGPERTGFMIVNPNKPQGLDDALFGRVLDALEQRINPGIALHGGRADLVAVEGRTVYVRLSGGCQGCGMASATLTQGIEATLTEAIPEIADVVDVTDHASGTNPYYQPAGAG